MDLKEFNYKIKTDFCTLTFPIIINQKNVILSKLKYTDIRHLMADKRDGLLSIKN